MGTDVHPIGTAPTKETKPRAKFMVISGASGPYGPSKSQKIDKRHLADFLGFHRHWQAPASTEVLDSPFGARSAAILAQETCALNRPRSPSDRGIHCYLRGLRARSAEILAQETCALIRPRSPSDRGIGWPLPPTLDQVVEVVGTKHPLHGTPVHSGNTGSAS